MQFMFISSKKLVGWLYVGTNVNMVPMISQMSWKILYKTTMQLQKSWTSMEK
jgi:hypothetical protein